MSQSMVVTIHRPAQRFDAMRALVGASDEIGPMTRDALKRRAPVGRPPNDSHPGRLRNSIRYERHTDGDGVTLEFAAHTPYAKYVVHGARPHEIRPVAAKALHWYGPSGPVFATLVHHPGNQPNRFPEEVIRAVYGPVHDIIKAHMTGGL